MWVPLENGLYGIGKIALLVALAPVTPEYGIIVSWFLPALVLLPPVNLLIFRRLLRRHTAPAEGHHERRAGDPPPGGL